LVRSGSFLRTTIHHFHEKAQSSQDAVADSFALDVAAPLFDIPFLVR
jgi:hypothetical protein